MKRVAFGFAIVHVFSHLKPLLDDYVNLKMESIKVAEQVEEATPVPRYSEEKMAPPSMEDLTSDLHYQTIPVFEMYGDKCAGETKVSPQDYEHLVSLTDKWRLNEWGHVFMRKHETDRKRPRDVRLTRILYEFNVLHVNGDRLDNRRTNLVPSRPAKEAATIEEDFKISTPRVLLEDFHNFRSDSKDLPGFTGYANIEYDGQKFYSGDVSLGKPHGYGHLYEGDKNAQSCGLWTNGVMTTGMIALFKPYPKCMCDVMKRCPLQEVETVHAVKNGKIVKG